MAILKNGLETMELGATAWRILINDNFTKLYTKTEINNALTAKASKNGDISQNFAVKDCDIKGILKLYSETPVNYDSAVYSAFNGLIEINFNGKAVLIPYFNKA